MNWRIDFSGDALKFLDQNNIQEDFIIDKIKLAFSKKVLVYKSMGR